MASKSKILEIYLRAVNNGRPTEFVVGRVVPVGTDQYPPVENIAFFDHGHLNKIVGSDSAFPESCYVITFENSAFQLIIPLSMVEQVLVFNQSITKKATPIEAAVQNITTIKSDKTDQNEQES